jgi:hypothetical protein
LWPATKFLWLPPQIWQQNFVANQKLMLLLDRSSEEVQSWDGVVAFCLCRQNIRFMFNPQYFLTEVVTLYEQRYY